MPTHQTGIDQTNAASEIDRRSFITLGSLAMLSAFAQSAKGGESVAEPIRYPDPELSFSILALPDIKSATRPLSAYGLVDCGLRAAPGTQWGDI